MTQKLIKIGNSVGVIIPKEMLDKKGLKAGNTVVIEENSINDAIMLLKEPSTPSYNTSITPEFEKVVQNVHKKYGKALKELANK